MSSLLNPVVMARTYIPPKLDDQLRAYMHRAKSNQVRREMIEELILWGMVASNISPVNTAHEDRK